MAKKDQTQSAPAATDASATGEEFVPGELLSAPSVTLEELKINMATAIVIECVRRESYGPYACGLPSPTSMPYATEASDAAEEPPRQSRDQRKRQAFADSVVSLVNTIVDGLLEQ